MSNTNTEVLTTAYENLQKAITQVNTVLPPLQEAIEKGNEIIQAIEGTNFKVNYSEGTDITINRYTRNVLVTATKPVSLKYIYGGIEGQRLVIYSNGNLTLVYKATDVRKTENIATKSRANEIIQNDHIVVLNYINSRWYAT